MITEEAEFPLAQKPPCLLAKPETIRTQPPNLRRRRGSGKFCCYQQYYLSVYTKTASKSILNVLKTMECGYLYRSFASIINYAIA